ncbi:hypothetical protein QYF36_008811 [Acer negundo]|nr:hypothetical protein QYF36_008811 [Acer negundo]
MCFKVICKQCGRYSWGGCGKHLATVYAGIEEGKHCMCRSWPGVVIPTDPAPTQHQPSSTSTTATGNNISNS